MRKVSQRKIKTFQSLLLEWFKTKGRKFNWRKKGLNNYQIIIAEILLQRTKAETVQKVYSDFLLKFPNWESLDKVKLKNLEKTIKPLGLYNQRSERIKRLAREMILRKGKLPRTKNEIEQLPFAGQYITNAILLFIKRKPAPLLDVNMARVLERFFGPRKLTDIRYDPYLQDLAWKIVNHKDAIKINWAVLDLAAIVCKSNKPNCTNCILQINCDYFNQ